MNRRRALIAAQGGGGETENFVRIGSPSITDHVLTTGSSGMIRTPEVFSPNNSSWKIRVGFTVTNATGYNDVYGTVNSNGGSERSVLLEGTSSKTYAVYLSSGANSWDIVSGQGGTGVTANVHVIHELRFDGDKHYQKRTSIDGGETWTSWASVVNVATKIKSGYYIGFGLSRNGYLIGSINLDECEIWINDTLWWKAYT